MKIFLSWSGERSKALAQYLRDWLPLVLHYAEPWLSQSDIEAGDRWATKVAKELESTSFGILIVTRENANSPWILFEAGALAKSIEEGHVVPLLLDIEFKDIVGPLAQFQAKKVEKDGLSDVVNAINRLAQQPVPDARLEQLVNLSWADLEKKIAQIPKAPSAVKHNRPQGEVLEELVASVRGLDIRLLELSHGEISAARSRKRDLAAEHNFFHTLSDLGQDDPLRVVVAASVFRDDAPWLYDLCLEAYRAVIGDSADARIRLEHLRSAMKNARHGPLRELRGRLAYAALDEINMFVDLTRVRKRPRPLKLELSKGSDGSEPKQSPSEGGDTDDQASN